MLNVNEVLKPTHRKRFLFFLTADIIIFAFSLYLSLLLRFDLNFDFVKKSGYLYKLLVYWLPMIILIKSAFFYTNRLYFVSWSFVSIEEFFRISISLIASLIFLMIFNYLYFVITKEYFMPRSVPVTDFFISLVSISAVRISKRFYLERIKKEKYNTDKKALVIGAGLTGERIVRELLRDDKANFYPIGFIDDSEDKQELYIHNIKVLGKLCELDNILSSNQLDAIIIAIPSLPYKKVRKIYEIAKKHSINTIKIVPSISKLPENYVNIKDLRDLKLEDLLARKPVKIDETSVLSFLKGKTILVTGASGSIGSEIVMQLVRFEPAEIIAFEIDETEIYYLQHRIDYMLKRMGRNVKVEYVVGDVKDMKKLRELFENYRIDVVFHAAAYKHVPLMEMFPEEAVKTNIFGTYNLSKLSSEFGVKKFVNISTDKAVNPASIMGSTKRAAEVICRAFKKEGGTAFVSVRFGNVLGSRGSVIPIFLEQIKNGGPVTVTHPDMKRYFMTIPEAVLLVFQAASMGVGGEVFVLDMGEPVKILDMAEDLIRLNGLEPYKDIDITFTGIRPGEKLFEEILTAEEGTVSTKHSKIYTAKINEKVPLEEIEQYLKDFETLLANNFEVNQIKEKLREFIKGSYLNSL